MKHLDILGRSGVAAAALFVCGVVAGLTPVNAAAQEKVVVYTVTPQEEINTGINDEFTRQTGIRVELLQIPAVGTLAARIESEAGNPRGDVFASAPVEFHMALAAKGLIENYVSPAVTPEAIEAGYADPEGAWTGWFGVTNAIYWNTDRLAELGVEPPKSWDDLLKPEYKGEIILANPQTSATGYNLLSLHVFRLGSEEAAWEYAKKLNENVAQYTPSAPVSVALVEQGEGAIGAFSLNDVLISKYERNQPIDFVIPDDNVVQVWASSIIKGGPNTEAAKKYIDFLQSEFAQEVNMRYGYRHALNPNVAAPKGAPPLSEVDLVGYDLPWGIENMDRMRAEFGQMIGQ